jgi:hypothetical protein
MKISKLAKICKEYDTKKYYKKFVSGFVNNNAGLLVNTTYQNPGFRSHMPA